MSKYHRDIILVVKDAVITPQLEDTRVDCLNTIIAAVDNVDGFCRAHELVLRFKITSKKNKILRAIEKESLKPFQFLLNKN